MACTSSLSYALENTCADFVCVPLLCFGTLHQRNVLSCLSVQRMWSYEWDFSMGLLATFTSRDCCSWCFAKCCISPTPWVFAAAGVLDSQASHSWHWWSLTSLFLASLAGGLSILLINVSLVRDIDPLIELSFCFIDLSPLFSCFQFQWFLLLALPSPYFVHWCLTYYFTTVTRHHYQSNL